jgi:purine nucleoside phosphorylase
MVDNWANGLAKDPLTLEQFRELVHQNEHKVEQIIIKVLQRLGAGK